MVAQTRVAGRYELKDLLGEGGMGVVYRAFDTKTKSDVAIKTMRDVADPVAAELFAKEWSVLAGLSHPNIVDIRDVGEIEDGNSRRPFFVMPLLPGVTLGKLIETSSARLTLERVVEIIKQVCRGLQAAHEQGIVHRDLKPSNIFVMDDDTAKIIDFGVVYLAGSNTVTGHKGTWQYMAPEQAQLQAATPASDIFSLGVVCYEALTGRKPFARKTPAETAEAARKFVPPPVSEVNSVVPHVVSMVVHKAMAKQPMHRFSSARDFSDTLVKAFHNEPIERFDTARIRPRLERARKASADGDHAFASEILAELEAEGHIDPEISLVRSQIDVAVRQKRVRQLLESARTRLEQDEIPLALEKVREALELDPDNAPVLGLRAEIEKQRNARQIQNWIQLAREHLDRRNYAEARQAVDEVLRIRSDDSHALRLAGEIKLREQESKRIRLEKEQLYGAALKSYQNGEISTALSKLERVLVLAREMPDATVPERDAAYQNLYNQIRSERDAIQNAYAESRRNVAEKNFGRALEICDQFLAKYPADALLQALRLQVVEAQRQDLSAYIAEVGKRAESEPDLDRRANILKEACERYPQEQQFQQSLRLTRERRDLVQGIAAKARQYEERGQFTEAVGQWDILRNIHPQYLGIDYEVEQLVRRRDRQALDDEKARIVTQIDCALEAGSFARARELAFNALSEFPNDQELSTLERLARQGVERSEEAKRLLAEGQKLCAEGRTKEGIERFERGVGIDDRNDPIRGVLVGTLLEQARSLLDTDLPEAERYTRRAADLDGAHPGVRSLGSLIADATRKEMVAKCLAEARELQAAGNIAAAVEQVEAQLSESQNDARLLQYRATLQNLVREERQRGERREDAAAIERLRSEQRAGSAEARTTLDRAALERAEAIRRRYPDDPQIAAAAADIRQRYISLSPQDDFSNLVPSEYRAGEVAMPGAAVPRTGSESPLAVAPPARERLKVIGSQLARFVKPFVTGMRAVREYLGAYGAWGERLWPRWPVLMRTGIIALPLLAIAALLAGILQLLKPALKNPTTGGVRNAHVHIRTTPPDAVVLINGKRSKQDCDLDADGTYFVVVSRLGYKSEEQKAKKVDTNWIFPLTPEPVRIRVLTAEKAGKVFLDNKETGDLDNGSFDTELAPDGVHRLTVRNPWVEVLAVEFKADAAMKPIVMPLKTKDLVVIGSFGENTTVLSGDVQRKISVDGKSAGTMKSEGLDLPRNSHEIALGEGQDALLIPLLKHDNWPTLLVCLRGDTNFGQVKVTTDALGARLFVNGTEETPLKTGGWRVRKAPGTLNLKLTAEGYQDYETAIDLKRGESQEIRLSLNPIAVTATVVIVGGTPGADILWDGKKIGTLDDSGARRSDAMQPGPHSIEFHKQGFEDSKANPITLIAGHELSLNAPQLVPFGAFDFVLSPETAKATFHRTDEKESYPPVSSGRVSVRQGIYKITISADEYDSVDLQQEVAPGQTLPVHQSLKLINVQRPDPKPPKSSVFENPSQLRWSGDWAKAKENVTVFLRQGTIDFELALQNPKKGFLWRGGSELIIHFVSPREQIVYTFDGKQIERKPYFGGKVIDKDSAQCIPDINGTISIQVKVARNRIVISRDGKALDEYRDEARDLTVGKIGIKFDGLFIVTR